MILMPKVRMTTVLFDLPNVAERTQQMTSCLFDLPIELRSLIFSSFSVRDISRLRQCCSAWKNNLQDLSFMNVLDFSYSPDITADDFDQLLEKRIDRTQNNIAKVILAHTSHLNLASLQKLFGCFRVRLKDIRIRHGFIGVRTAAILSVLLQQQDLECIVYVQWSDTDSPDVDPNLEFKCTKLKRFKLRLSEVMCFPRKAMLKLVALNPSLKNDLDYLGGIARMFYDYDNEDSSANPLLDLALSSNNLHVYEVFWNEVAGSYRRPSYVPQLLDRTLQLLHEMPDDQRQSNTMVHAICFNIRFTLREERNLDTLMAIVDNRHWLDPLADKCNVNRAKKDVFKLDQWFAMLKKRPFYTAARDAYLSASLEALTVYRRDDELEERYNAELSHLTDTISTIMKTLPFEIRLLRASLWLRQGKLKEAFDEFIATMNPTYVLDMEKLCFNMATQNIQALCGAYHVAKDYLKSPELLERISPENNKLLTEHFEKLQPCFDQGVCTRSIDSTFRKQYWYACYTCGFNGGFRGLCYSCTKTCHVGHKIDYMEIAEFTCDDPNCEFEEVPEIEEQADDEGVQFQGDNVGWENDDNS